MTQLLEYTVEGGVAVLSMNHPPTNALTAELRAAVFDALQAALDDKMVGAIVLLGAGSEFSAGRDYSELGNAIAHPNLSELCSAIEAAGKPVVAGLSGAVMGGGLELAWACHYRVALSSSQVAMPEVALGVMPGAGGTQRAPRLLGADTALNILLSGVMMPVTDEAVAGMVDEIAEKDLREAAIIFALTCIAKYKPARPTSEATGGIADFQAFQAGVAKWEKRIEARGQDAALAIIEAVRAAPLLPFEVGLEFERERFDELVTSDQSRALRHVALAERRSARLPELHQAEARPVKTLGVVVGADRVGADLALAALQHGLSVVLTAPVPAALALAQRRIEAAVQRMVTSGRMEDTASRDMLVRLRSDADFVALSRVDLVIEAVGQGREISRQIAAQLDGIIKEGAVLAVHDAAAQIGPVAQATGSPQDVVGVYVPNLHLRTSGAEVAVGKSTGPEAVATLFTVLSTLGFLPVRTKTYSGLIGQNVLGACVRAAEDLLRLGADPYEIDRVMHSWGFMLGPFQIADALGLNAPGLRTAQAGTSTVLYRMGREGRRAQRGWYHYSQDHPFGAADADALRILQAAIEEDPKPVANVGVRDGDIETTCLAAMANAGTRLLRMGVAAKPSDIDVTMINGFGFPRWRGGPMQASDDYGLVPIRNHLRQMAEHGDGFWKPEPLFDTLIKNGRGFGALNG
ncbi:enoyl-CoA hydratase-related protein [Shimia sagamensis]|uniref:3-hydroxyacyl-CoA dehydrogenase n=1 Tax=Shimia sagamensis TaxID=1566352 RepID=A0ABY1PL12_9RHOB|nr:enoyl-CoA hydratase-related protein [Shimia sagamensis]SMP36221.1 3-hydroxyacyl-CoA dehydrogenase [Shimia sagamensis]